MIGTATESATSYPRFNPQSVRLFRADTPHDVASACLVAGLSPARDYLAISADYAAADPREYLQVMRAMARAHRWLDIIDISRLPINDPDRMRPRPPRRDLYRTMRESFDMLRTTIAGHIQPDAVDELFLTCLNHADIRLLSQVLPAATLSHYPHGFGSLHDAENDTYVAITKSASLGRRARHAALEAVKRPLWGRASTPPLSLDIFRSHSFHRYPLFGHERHDLTHLMTTDTMARLFAALPDEIRQAYEAHSSDRDAAAGLLLLTPADTRGPDYPYEVDLRGFGELASHLLSKHGVGGIIIKPHPLNSDQWITTVADAVRASVPEASVVTISRYSAVPVEIAASAMRVVAAAGIGSSSLHTLARIYGIPTYSSDRLLRELYADEPRMASSVETWIKDNKTSYTSV